MCNNAPFNYKELLLAEAFDWKKLLWRGGFPKSFLAHTDAQSLRWRESYIQSFLERDLRQFGLNLNPQHLRRLWLMICHAHGQIVNYSQLGQSLDMTHSTIKRHIDILESTFMVRRLPPFAVNLKKRLVKSPKIYIRDTGLLTSFLEMGDFNKLYSHPIYGYSWEGFAIESVLSLFKTKGLYGFFRTRRGEEIDLIIESQGRLLGFEFKTSSHPKLSSGTLSALKLLNLDKLFVVVPEGRAHPMKESQIWVTSLEELARISHKVPWRKRSNPDGSRRTD